MSIHKQDCLHVEASWKISAQTYFSQTESYRTVRRRCELKHFRVRISLKPSELRTYQKCFPAANIGCCRIRYAIHSIFVSGTGSPSITTALDALFSPHYWVRISFLVYINTYVSYWIHKLLNLPWSVHSNPKCSNLLSSGVQNSYLQDLLCDIFDKLELLCLHWHRRVRGRLQMVSVCCLPSAFKYISEKGYETATFVRTTRGHSTYGKS